MGKVKALLHKNKDNREKEAVKRGESMIETESLEAEIQEFEFYGIERQFKRAVMFNLRLKGGVFAAFPYSYVTKILFDPSITIEIYVADSIVSIKGRNLHIIYNYLMQHRLSFIKENISDYDTTLENEVFISAVEIKINT